MKHVRVKDHMVGASLRMKCETIGTVSFNATAVDKIPVEIRASFSDRKFIFIFFLFLFSDMVLCFL